MEEEGGLEQRGVTVGCKVPEWRAEALREIARKRRTTMSAILRKHIRTEVSESDVDQELAEKLLQERNEDKANA